MTLTNLQQAKLKKLFDVYDYDGNGFVEREDYLGVIKNLASLKEWAPGTPEYMALQNAYLSLWEGLKDHADTDFDGKVDFAEMSAYCLALMSDPDQFQDKIIGLGALLFELLDVDEDGVVSKSDYLQFARCLRFDPGEEAFAHLDVGNKGGLSKGAALARIEEFYLSQDEQAPGNWLFGKLHTSV